MRPHFLAWGALVAAACVPQASKQTGTDATTAADEATTVCNHLEAVGCIPSSKIAGCAQVWRTYQGKTVDFHPACLLAAKDPALVEACGSMMCAGPDDGASPR